MRDIELKVRFSPEELSEIDSKRGRVRRAVYLRAAGLGQKAPRPFPQPIAAGLVELSRIGNNLNQVARLMNEAGASPELIEVVRAEVISLRIKLSDIGESICES